MLPEYTLDHVVGDAADVASGSGFTVTEQADAWLVQVTMVADSQVTAWAMRSGSSWESGGSVATATDGALTIPKASYAAGGVFLIRPALAAGGFGELVLTVTITPSGVAPVAGLTWRIAEPDMVWTWSASPAAVRYRVTWEVLGVASEMSVATPTVTVAIPRGPSVMRVRAVDAQGNESEPVEEELAAAVGSYAYNEVVRIGLPIASGRGVNLCVPSGTQIRRASVLGTTPTPPITGENDCDLYSFPDDLEPLGPVSNYADIPLSWFKEKWWYARAGWWESAVCDLGAIYSGYINISLTKTVVDYGATQPVSAYADLPAGRVEDFTVDQLTEARTFVSAQIMVSEDGLTWNEAVSGQWLQAVRFVKLIVTVSEASPLSEVLITAGSIWLDVPDIVESGTALNVGTSYASVTLAKKYRTVTSAIATARGVAKAEVGAITKSGETWSMTVKVNSGTATVDWFVKGY